MARKKLRTQIVLMILFALSSTSLFADSLVLDDTATVFDGAIYGSVGCNSEFPDLNCAFYNMGGQITFSVGKSAAHISTVWRSLMGFDLAELYDGGISDIDSAILTLKALFATSADSVLYLGFQSLNYDVIEGNCAVSMPPNDSSFTWSARIFKDEVDTVLWQIAGAKGSDDREDSVYAISPPITGADSYRIDLTGLVRHWLDSTATRRWCVLGDTVSLAGGRAFAKKVFSSSESSTASNRPKLEIFYPTVGLQRSDIMSGGLLK
ncbi:MAG: hypothetical protein KKG33_12970 [candidate division Zixibacteria bacterium]|nr:hypothetical protein [candidate division Zixibacteria bacterium]